MRDPELAMMERSPPRYGEGEGDAPRGTTRRVSAIMFTDMVGYTALMQEDESRARRDRDRQRVVLGRHIEHHGGRILLFYGDGALSVFDSAIEAVSSAVNIQRELAQEPRIALRVGIHTGDVVYDDEGVFGDGVNIAARIQSLGTSGSVLVSGKVYDEIKNQRHLRAVSLGEFNLKNVQRPLEVFAIAAEGVTLPQPESLPKPGREAHRSVAVLPFMNMSADPENEYFSDGITEELINVLTRVNGLQVTARTSSFAFKGKRHDVRQIAKRLGVETVLEGSVRKFGDRLRIAAQLIVGEPERAVEEMELAVRLDPLSLIAMHSLVWAYEQAGRYEDALALDEREQVLHYFEAAAERRLGVVLFSVNDPLWQDLRTDPRYWQLLDRYGLTRIRREQPPAS
jgi:class 3 adenylate cyclase